MESLYRKAVMYVWQLSVGICLLCSCGEGTGEVSGALDRAEGCMDEHPDSALVILDSIGADTLRLAAMSRADKIMLRKRALLESIDELKNIA